jgi:signal transduction histidine kinase
LSEHEKNYEGDGELEKRVNERISRISSELTHDLRSPLQTIRNAVYLIERDPDNPVFYQMIKDSLQQATEILDGFREYYKGNILRLIKSDLYKVYEIGKSSVEIPDNISLVEEIEECDEIEIDPGKISKVLGILLKNAVQAQPEGGMIVVKIKDENDVIQVSISDKGKGISPQVQEVLFTPFESQKKHGKGLGLPAAKRILESHGGSISYETEEGEGTTFNIFLPKD